LTYLYPGPLRTSLRRFGLTDERVRTFFDRHSARMMERAGEISPFEEVVRIIKKLNVTDYTVVTSSYSETVKNVLSTVMDSAEVNRVSIMGRELKMKKSLKFKEILKETCGEKTRLVKIGDMVSDILYANDVGIDCAVVGWGYHPMEYLRAFDAMHYIERPIDLDRFVSLNLVNGERYG
jgi:phosphoglycolate phosphatase-like HAD superfamily hydrolase